jgi:N-acetylmuramoyl-L-alanine amidase
LRDFLQQAGALVVMTRESDRDLANDDTKRMSHRKKEDLVRRMEFIKAKQASMLVSIHLNSFPVSKYNGAQTFYYTNHPANRTFAETMQNELRKQLENTTRVAKKVDNVYILKTSSIPSILVEIGFLSNDEEARQLANQQYQKKLADAMYRGIIRYSIDGTVSKKK